MYIYNQNQRLIQINDGAITANYTYNGNGQRVKKVVNGTTTIFHYSLSGQIIAESNSAGSFTAEYVYLNGQPLTKIEGSVVYYYHNDHLGTPQKMTDSSGTVVWSADYKPFGEAAVSQSSTITNNLRFPGQYYDAETGLNYNYYRDYNPVIGRYMQADPIGLRGGLKLYSYAENNPIQWIDPEGLKGRISRCKKPRLNRDKMANDVADALDSGDYNCNRIDFDWECVKRNCNPECNPNKEENQSSWYVNPKSSSCVCLEKTVITVFGMPIEEKCLRSTCNPKCKEECPNKGPEFRKPSDNCPCVEWKRTYKLNWVD